MYCWEGGTTGGIQCRVCRGTGSQEAWDRKTYQPQSSRKTCVGSCSHWLSLVFSIHSWPHELAFMSALRPPVISEKMSNFFPFAVIRTGRKTKLDLKIDNSETYRILVFLFIWWQEFGVCNVIDVVKHHKHYCILYNKSYLPIYRFDFRLMVPCLFN